MASGGVPMVVREGGDVAKTIRRQFFLLDALVLMQQRLEIAENKAAELKETLDAKGCLVSATLFMYMARRCWCVAQKRSVILIVVHLGK